MNPDAVWPLWRSLLKGFGAWRTAGVALTSPAVVGVYGVDFASSLRRSRMGRHAEAVLAGIDAPTFEALCAIAAVNVERNEAMWRMAVMFYVSVPVTLTLATLQVAPTFFRYVMEMAALPFWLAVSGLLAFMLYSFVTLWRARQAQAVLALLRMERGLVGAPDPAPPRARRRSARPGGPRA